MLCKDPHRRPSIKKILEREFLSNRISNLLSQTVAKHEFGRTFLERPTAPEPLPTVSPKESHPKGRELKHRSRAESSERRHRDRDTTPEESKTNA